MHEATRTLDESLSYASFWRRLGAWVIDFIIVGIASSILSLGMDFIGGFATRIVVGVALGLLAVAYHCGFESSKHQATPGKMVLGLVVTDINGQRLTFVRALARHLSMHVCNITLGIGYLMILWTKKHQGLHDKIGNCLVVRKPKILGCGHQHAPMQAR